MKAQLGPILSPALNQLPLVRLPLALISLALLLALPAPAQPLGPAYATAASDAAPESHAAPESPGPASGLQPGSGLPNGLPGKSARWRNPLGMEFIYVPAGPQRTGYRAPRGAGDTAADDYIVWIAKPYYLQASELSQAQWQAVTGQSEPAFCAAGPCGPDYPAHSLSPARIDAFIAQLNARTGLAYRLPTRPEWERAASAGNWRSRYWWGDDARLLPSYENCRPDRSGLPWWQAEAPAGRLEPVASRRPNPLGFYDLLGNVSELLAHPDELWPGGRLEPARHFGSDITGYLRAYTDFPQGAPAGAPGRDGAGGNYRRLAPACDLGAGSGLRQGEASESDAPEADPAVGFRLLIEADGIGF